MSTNIIHRTIMALVRSPLHTLLGESWAVIQVRGLKTGQLYTLPINLVRDGETMIVVSYKHRTWWRNLREGQHAMLRIGGKDLEVRGELVEADEDVRNGLLWFFEKYPGYARYFNVQRGKDGRPFPEDLERLVQERVLIRLYPL